MTKLSIFLVMVFLHSPLWAQPPLKVTIEDRDYSTSGKVDVTVKNIGQEDRGILVWSQPGCSWTSDNRQVQSSRLAKENMPYEIKLKPGEEYQQRVDIWVITLYSAAPMTFRLGLCPEVNCPPWSDFKTSKDIIWSNPLTLKQK
jgi:hypothetical protein